MVVEIDEKQAFLIVQKAKESGSLKIGANEVTKAIERKQAKLVLAANDVSPAEIVAHMPGLCSEMSILFTQAGSKAELGALVGIKSTTALAVTDAGAAKAELAKLEKSLKEESKSEEKAEVKEEAKEE